MSHILGVYYAPGHNRYEDQEYIRALQPPAVRVLDPDVAQLALVHRLAPNALLLPRDWALSEQHDDVRRDPAGTGVRHAQDWRGKIDRWRSTGAQLPGDDRIVVVGINEPRVWDSAVVPWTVEYNVAFLDECTRLGLRACALNLSVGWPGNTGPDTPPDWSPYAPVLPAIKRGNHYLCVHEYWYRTGPQDGAGWWAWRIRHNTWDVPIIIGETGVDNYVDNDRWNNEGKPPRGWGGNVAPATYADQVTRYARGLDKRVVAILPFLTDYRSREWASFDTAGAAGELLASASQMVPQATVHTIHIPAVIAPQPQPPVTPSVKRILDTRVMEAVAQAESGRRAFGQDGRLIVRVEAHLLLSRQYGKPDLFEPYFAYTPNNIFEAFYRQTPQGPWIAYHGDQRREHEALALARRLHNETALRCTSMGAGQVMGFNAGRVGFTSAQEMFDVMSRSESSHYVAMCNYMLSDPALHAAVNARDWPEIGRRYNGSASAGELYRAAYVALWGGP